MLRKNNKIYYWSHREQCQAYNRKYWRDRQDKRDKRSSILKNMTPEELLSHLGYYKKSFHRNNRLHIKKHNICFKKHSK
jgi:hypothetical protein